MSLPFCAAQPGGMCQHKIDEIFKKLSNELQMTYYDVDDKDYGGTLRKVIKMCHKETLKLNKDKMSC